MILQWTPIRTSLQRGSPIVYWRLADPALGGISRRKADGSVAYNARDTASWHAVMYGPDPRASHQGRQDLGLHPTRLSAERSVHDALRRANRLITCPRCRHSSFNPNDIREGYCGRCSDWTSPKEVA